MMRTLMVICIAACTSFFCSSARAEGDSQSETNIVHEMREALPPFFAEHSITGMCVNLYGDRGYRQSMNLDFVHQKGCLDVYISKSCQTRLEKDFSASEWKKILRIIQLARFETWESSYSTEYVDGGCTWNITFFSPTSAVRKIVGCAAAPRYILWVDDIVDLIKEDVLDMSFAHSFALVSVSAEIQWIKSSVRKWQDDQTGLTWFYTPADDSKWWGSSIIGVCPHPSGELKIPSSIESTKIVRISPRALRNCMELTSVEFPATVVEIGDDLFDGCENLKEITFKGPRPSFTELLKGYPISGHVAADKCVIYADTNEKGWCNPDVFCGFRVLHRAAGDDDNGVKSKGQ